MFAIKQNSYTLFGSLFMQHDWFPLWLSLRVAALAFARSLGDFGVTIMLAGNIPGRTQTVAVAIYDAVEGGNGDLARWLVLAVSALAIALLTLANALAPKRA